MKIQRKINNVTRTAGVLFAFVLASVTSAQAAPDAVYVNGQVVTVDEQFSIVGGFAIEGDRFSALGASEEMLALADENTRIVDLAGRTVIPGLIDNHNHFIRGAHHWANLLRLDGVDSRAEALKLLQQHAEQLDSNEWLLVLGGWNEEQFADDPRGFTRGELDQIAGDRPAFLQAQYSHAFVNTAFLEYIGVDVAAPSPKLSSNPTVDAIFGPPLQELIERDDAGVATSRLGGGMGMVLQTATIMPPQTPAAALEGVQAAQQYLNSLGLTTVYDPAGALATEAAIDPIEQLHGEGSLSLRVFRTVQLGSLDADSIGRALQLRMLPGWLAEIIVGFVNDVESTSGAVDQVAELSAMSTGDDFYDRLAIGEVVYVPLHDSMDWARSDGHVTNRRKSEVRNLLAEILKHDLSVQIHAVNSWIIGTYLDIIEELAQEYTLRPNQIAFTHAEGVNEDLLRRIEALGITLQIRSMQVVRASDSLQRVYGAQTFSMPPLRMLQESGATWGLGTDGTKAAQINPMRTLHWAVTGQAINGDQVLEGGQRLTREEALIAHTRSNASLVNRSDSLGQIKAGFLADFVVLDADYLSVEVADIPAIKPQMTVVGGEVVFQQ